MATSKTTRDHEEIRKWAEQRGGKPSHVKSTGNKEDIGILRIDFPGYSGEGSLEPISWEEWFKKFDERNLSLLYQEETAGGEKSNFNKIVSAGTARAARGQGGPSASKKTTAKRFSAKNSAARKAGAKKSAFKRSAKAGKKAATKKAAKKKSGSKRSVKTATKKKSTSKKTTSKRRR